MGLAIGIPVLICCIAADWWAIKRSIEEGIWLEANGYPRALGSKVVTVYLSWLVASATIYYLLPATPALKGLVGLVVFIGGNLMQAKLVGDYIKAKAKEVQATKEMDNPQT